MDVSSPVTRTAYPKSPEAGGPSSRPTANGKRPTELSSPKDFRDLHVWKLGKEITIQIYKESNRFPKEEMYGLVQQMRSASVSISSNIAEGYNRRYCRDYARFLAIALGSCGELETQVEISRDLNYLNPKVAKELLEAIDHETRMIRSLINKIEPYSPKKLR